MDYKLTIYRDCGVWGWSITSRYDNTEVATSTTEFKTREEAQRDGILAMMDWQE